jgi:hypothetical protein
VLEGPSLEIHIECRRERSACRSCGQFAHLKDQRPVGFVDLRCLGRPTTLVSHKRRWRCPGPDCPTPTWTEEDDRIAGRRLLMTNRAGRWATEQVGRFGRTVSEVATELGCDWHTVNDTVVAFGELFVDHPRPHLTAQLVSELALNDRGGCRGGRCAACLAAAGSTSVAGGERCFRCASSTFTIETGLSSREKLSPALSYEGLLQWS